MLSQGRIVIVFDAIVRPSIQKFGYISPFVAVNLVCIKYYPLFFIINWRLFDARIKMIVPSFSALFACSSSNLIFIG